MYRYLCFMGLDQSARSHNLKSKTNDVTTSAIKTWGYESLYNVESLSTNDIISSLNNYRFILCCWYWATKEGL